MSRDNGLRTGKRQVSNAKTAGLDGDAFVMAALSFFAGAPEEAQRFFGWSGIEAAGLRLAAGQPDFIPGLLDYFAQNLRSLERFGDAAGIGPAEVMRLHDTHRVAGLTSHDEN